MLFFFLAWLIAHWKCCFAALFYMFEAFGFSFGSAGLRKTHRVFYVLFGELGVSGQRFGHTFTNTHRAIDPGNVRNLRSEVLSWGCPLSSESRQLLLLQGHLVSEVWMPTFRAVKQTECVVMAVVHTVVSVWKVVFRLMCAVCGWPVSQPFMKQLIRLRSVMLFGCCKHHYTKITCLKHVAIKQNRCVL